jgi:hypothetical protein
MRAAQIAKTFLRENQTAGFREPERRATPRRGVNKIETCQAMPGAPIAQLTTPLRVHCWEVEAPPEQGQGADADEKD